MWKNHIKDIRRILVLCLLFSRLILNTISFEETIYMYKLLHGILCNKEHVSKLIQTETLNYFRGATIKVVPRRTGVHYNTFESDIDDLDNPKSGLLSFTRNASTESLKRQN